MISEAGARIKIHALRQESVDPFRQNMQIYFIYLFIRKQTRQIRICLSLLGFGRFGIGSQRRNVAARN